MNIVITGSLGNISRRLTEKLTAKGHLVTVVSQNPERITAIRALNATPAIGSVEDPDFLIRTFNGADAVYTMLPPNFHTPDLREFMRKVGRNYAKAIATAGIRHVVNLSGLGAHLPDGPALAGAYYDVENYLDQVQGLHTLHLRPSMFYTNFYDSAELIKQQHIIGHNFEGTVTIPLTHPHDIADVAAEHLHTLSFTGKNARYVVSDEKNGHQIARILGEAIGKPTLPWITFTNEQLIGGMMQKGLSEDLASSYVAIGVALQEGSILSHYRQTQPEGPKGIPFADFAKEFAAVYKKQEQTFA
ncbi:MAG TPA: NAD(P)H-binding protein [Puia sp.]|nr:NAD(P)H-binding protein [Puia sp.]